MLKRFHFGWSFQTAASFSKCSDFGFTTSKSNSFHKWFLDYVWRQDDERIIIRINWHGNVAMPFARWFSELFTLFPIGRQHLLFRSVSAFLGSVLIIEYFCRIWCAVFTLRFLPSAKGKWRRGLIRKRNLWWQNNRNSLGFCTAIRKCSTAWRCSVWSKYRN